jgi:hypothetical protein
MMKQFVRIEVVLAMFGVLVLEGCTASLEKESSESIVLGDPHAVADVCQRLFSKPLKANDMCVAEVSVEKGCDGGSQGMSIFVAVPIAKSCDLLVEHRDFFPRSLYGGDPHFALALSQAAFLLRKEAANSSKGLLSLGSDIARELCARQMGALSGILLSQESGYEYDFSFLLPDSKSVVILTMSANGRKFRWAKIISN